MQEIFNKTTSLFLTEILEARRQWVHIFKVIYASEPEIGDTVDPEFYIQQNCLPKR